MTETARNAAARGLKVAGLSAYTLLFVAASIVTGIAHFGRKGMEARALPFGPEWLLPAAEAVVVLTVVLLVVARARIDD